MTSIQAVFVIEDAPIVINDQILIGNDDFDFTLQYRFTDDNQLLVDIEAVNKTDRPPISIVYSESQVDERNEDKS